ncbi:MAG: hypothetical protein KC503_18330 [Myxococcales bacterium]|nr:hypothetical protein [Myxococcales bacterium]
MTNPRDQLGAREPLHLRVAAAMLRPFAKVEPREVASVTLLSLSIFVLLTAYYLLKVVREPLILLSSGAEAKSYVALLQVLLAVGVVRLYSWLCQRSRSRMRVITSVTSFFIVTLVVLCVLALAGAPIGIVFFMWVGVFSVTTIAQFWSLANDVFTREQGERVFPVIGIGSSLGAAVGSQVARMLLRPIGIYWMMPVAALLLIVHLGVTYVVHRREPERLPEPREPDDEEIAGEAANADADHALGGGSSVVKLFLERPYLILVGALTLLLNTVNTTGEYILDRTILESASTAASSASTFIAGVRASFFTWVNVCGLLLQMFVVSRVVGYFGVRIPLIVIPLASLAGYGSIAFAPLLAVILVAKVAENSIDYSLHKTVREMLFLIVPREAKYRAKNAVETVFWRSGDALAAAIIWTGSHLGFAIARFVHINIVMVGLWFGLAVAIAAYHRRESGDVAPAASAA